MFHSWMRGDYQPHSCPCLSLTWIGTTLTPSSRWSLCTWHLTICESACLTSSLFSTNFFFVFFVLVHTIGFILFFLSHLQKKFLALTILLLLNTGTKTVVIIKICLFYYSPGNLKNQTFTISYKVMWTLHFFYKNPLISNTLISLSSNKIQCCLDIFMRWCSTSFSF